MKNKIKILTTLIFIISLLITACAGKDEVGQVGGQEDEKAVSEDEVLEPETLDFVDAFGEWHRAEIDPLMSKHEYSPEGFFGEGDSKGYEDDRFYSRRGIDVSSHQGDIYWDAVKEEGYEFAIIRAGFRGYGHTGSLNTDEYFLSNLEGAKAAGLDVGVYFFSQAINEQEAIEEARYVLDLLKEHTLALGICYDPEHILDDEARTDDVSGEQFTANAVAFCETVENAGYDAFIYSNMMWEAYELDLKQLGERRIWYADYEEIPQTPYRFELWQYSESGNVEGIQGPVDLDLQIIRK